MSYPLDPQSLLQGYLIGQNVRNSRRSEAGERMLIGSTYNGVPLPALPDWGGAYSTYNYARRKGKRLLILQISISDYS